VIGNSAYGAKVVSGVEDATAMADYLKQAGFPEPKLLLNRKRAEMLDDLKAFGLSIKNASVVVVYYSGHGFQLSGKNYLQPVDGTVAPNGSVPLSKVADALANAPDAVKIVFLDACRDRIDLSPGVLKGLAEMPAPKNTVFAFAAAPDQAAVSGNSDTDQKLSPYTEALLRDIREPGLELRDFLARVHAQVALNTGGRQAPTEFGLSHFGERKIFLRDPVVVKARIEEVDDSMVVFLNGKLALQRSEGQEAVDEPLSLRAGDNNLSLFVSNEKTYRRNQNWERPEGWHYRFQVYRADGQPLLCSEHTEEDGCFSAGEEVPFKDGPRHGKLFQVAEVNLFVDPASAQLTFRDRNDSLWSKETPLSATNQGVLFERQLFSLPLDRILGGSNAALGLFFLGLVAPEPDKILVTARGNLNAKAAVQACLGDEERWIETLRASIDLAIKHQPTPFESFDDELTKCAQEKDPSLERDDIRVYTALEDRHGEEQETALAKGVTAELRASTAGAGELTTHSDLLDRLATLFSPIESVQHQLAAVRVSDAQLKRLNGPLLYASISASELQAHLPSSLEARFNVAMGSGKAQVAKIELRDQEIVVWTAFEIVRPEIDLTLLGEAEIHAAAAVDRGALVLQPSAKTVHFTKARLGNLVLDLDHLAVDVGSFVRAMLGDVSHALEIQRIPLRLGDLQTFDLTNFLGGVEGLANINAKPTSFNVGLGAAALLVDAAGVHVLADAVVLTPERFESTVAELRREAEKGETSQLTSDQLAVLGECGQPLALPETLALTFAGVCAAFSSVAHSETPTPVDLPERTEEALKRELESFREKFRAAVDRIEPVDRISWDRTLIAFSRSQLAAGLNDILPGLVAQATVRPSGIQAEIPPENRTIRTPPSTNLNCSQQGGACPSVFSYPPYNPRGCPSNCGFFDFGCHAEKAGCEALKESERIAYETAKAAAQTAFTAEKAACESAKAGKQAGCFANQLWLDQTSGLDVGELRGSVEVQEVELPLTLDQVRIGKDLETIDLRLSATGGGEVSGNLTVVPHNLGHLACVSQWDAALKARVSLPQQQKSLHLARTAAGTDTGDELLLTYDLSETPLQLKFEPPPIKAFLEQNAGKLALSCPLPALVVGTLAGFPGVGLAFGIPLQQEILRDTFDLSVPAQKIPLVIPGQTIPMDEGEPVRLVPSWGEKAILFEAR
jgi:hypothetical protein